MSNEQKIVKNLKKIVYALSVYVIIIMSTSTSVYAKNHEHATSFMTKQLYKSGYIASHPYYDYGTKTCEIWGYYYREVWSCACGYTDYRNYSIVTRHTSNCGE